MIAFRSFGTTLLVTAGLALAGASMNLGAQNVYKIIDEDGSIEYTDRPPLGQDARPVETVSGLDIDFTDPELLQARSEAAEGRLEAEQAAEAERQEELAEEQAELQAQEQVRKDNCVAAKDRLNRYKQNNRIYRTNKEGDREYLNSEEIDAVRVKAENSVKEWCS